MYKRLFVTACLISAAVLLVYVMYEQILPFKYNKFQDMNNNIGQLSSPVLNHSTKYINQVLNLNLNATSSRADFPIHPAATVPVSVNYTTELVTNVPYLTIQLKGRLGNQMFEFASMVGLARSQNRKPFLKSGAYVSGAFQISLVEPNISSKGWKIIGESSYGKFDLKLTNLPEVNVSLYGYLQSWRYFIQVQDEIRREFTLRTHLQKYTNDILTDFRRQLRNHVLVGVHVRRGDFLDPNFMKAGYGVANASYFTKAFSKMRSLLPNQNITFLVASEDLDWCKNNLNDSSVRFLPRGNPSEHMAVLSSCDHVILTGGTYGWWSAWLANGITIYYINYVPQDKPLHKHFNDGDYYPPGWIGLDN